MLLNTARAWSGCALSAARPMLALPLLTVIAAAPSQQTDTLDLLWPSPILKVIDPTAQANNKALSKLLNDLSRFATRP